MGDRIDTFERLVLTMESSERRDLLRQLAERAENKTEAFKGENARVEGIPSGDDSSPERMFSSQPFFVRLWFALVAFFSSKSSTQAFGAHLVKLLGKKLARSYATYINVSQRMYTDEFHRHLVRLSDIQRFFSSLLGVYEANKGGFFLILSSLAMKDTYERIAVYRFRTHVYSRGRARKALSSGPWNRMDAPLLLRSHRADNTQVFRHVGPGSGLSHRLGNRGGRMPRVDPGEREKDPCLDP
jgi:hypothetical protein